METKKEVNRTKLKSRFNLYGMCKIFAYRNLINGNLFVYDNIEKDYYYNANTIGVEAYNIFLSLNCGFDEILFYRKKIRRASGYKHYIKLKKNKNVTLISLAEIKEENKLSVKDLIENISSSDKLEYIDTLLYRLVTHENKQVYSVYPITIKLINNINFEDKFDFDEFEKYISQDSINIELQNSIKKMKQCKESVDLSNIRKHFKCNYKHKINEITINGYTANPKITIPLLRYLTNDQAIETIQKQLIMEI